MRAVAPSGMVKSSIFRVKVQRCNIRIGFDIDGVVCDFHSAFIKACGGNPDNWKKWTSYPFEDCPVDIPNEKKLEIWDRLQPDQKFWASIEPAYGSSIARVAETSRSHATYFITHRPIEAFAATAQWLYDHDIRPAGLLFLKDKRRACSGLRIEAFLDDYGNVVSEFEGYKLQAFILDRPWNRDLKVAKRVTSVGNFLDEVLKN